MPVDAEMYDICLEMDARAANRVLELEPAEISQRRTAAEFSIRDAASMPGARVDCGGRRQEVDFVTTGPPRVRSVFTLVGRWFLSAHRFG
jgi:hypothetical protein